MFGSIISLSPLIDKCVVTATKATAMPASRVVLVRAMLPGVLLRRATEYEVLYLLLRVESWLRRLCIVASC
jgi:hypothetical protein